MRNVTARSTDAAEPAATTAAPGARAQTTRIPPRPAHAVQRRAATGSTPPAPTVSFAELATAFDFGAPIAQGVQRRDGGAARGGDVGTIAAAGVASASAPLPHADAIQRAFGRHDVGHVRAQIGGAGAAASAAIGATAYATGDRVAFATAPDLHLAAHEAAHVVQQRGGVQLAGGVGAAGDRYERHADRVADLVVAGRSAEAALDALAGGGGGATAVQRHDSPTHVRTGDSVPGEGVTLTDAATGETLTFSPGELSALVDYVGFCDGLQQRFTWEQLQKMKYLLENGIEDVLPWEDATGGLYAKEAQANEKHFAPSPGDGGANFRSNFINHYGRALMYGQGGNAEQARLALYTAEHYLQDAFSAGHQLAAKDVESAVQAQIGWFGTAKAAGEIADRVWAQASTEIQHYGFGISPKIATPLTQTQFKGIATGGALLKGSAGFVDAVRQSVHEDLAATGVEVTSKAHPEPFTLQGDHDLAKDSVGIVCLQAALAEVRAKVDAVAGQAIEPTALATELFDKHCPIPTSTGRATVGDVTDARTETPQAIFDAVVEAMVRTIEGVMDTALAMVPGLQKISDVFNQPHEFPDLPAYDPDGDAPVTGQPVGEPGGSLPSTDKPYVGRPVGEPGGSLP
ncbi:MAG: DUF4157 domain-containing protein [Myxococcales bacterium]|nr:DUF4157 domain-containing protein [Myxococcales bacterium]MBK7192490.1 DUF4157 domain-containing protein [Myxococcales bacterium]MBP6846298.1 DUF4157 domain-containing protein [Kofleriaceae bacterium]